MAPPELAGAVLGTVSFSAAKGLNAEALLLETKRDRERERLLGRVVSDRRPVAAAVLFSVVAFSDAKVNETKLETYLTSPSLTVGNCTSGRRVHNCGRYGTITELHICCR